MDNNTKTKVGICTFHYAVNPGSALQAYALYKVLGALSPQLDVSILNYHSPKYPPLHIAFRRALKRHKLRKQRIFNVFAYIRYQRFFDCIGGLGRRWDNKNIAQVTGYDVIVAGSDQIWNLELTKHNFNFFIPFCKGAKKIAYAASIGSQDFPEEDKPAVAGLLKDFSYISVREPQAQTAIENLIGVRPELVLDPSLLLSGNDWEKLARKPKIKGDYIFLYLRHKENEIAPLARRFAQKNGLILVECHNRLEKLYKEDLNLCKPEPRDWLGLLLGAKYVFTDSFHGCAFCTNCHKQFFVKISANNAEMSPRIYNLLGRYGLTDRMIDDESELYSLPDIDFSASDALLEEDRKHSMDYLKKALGV